MTDAPSVGETGGVQFAPMLASTGPLPARGTWSFEPKLDGWRALVYVGDGVRVMSRRGKELTSSVPELQSLSAVLPAGTVLDGELVVGDGRPGSFYGLVGRMASRRASETTMFMAFDLLADDGADCTAMPYIERRAALRDLSVTGSAWATVPSWDLAPELVGTVCIQHGLEGMVAKRQDSRYRCGQRSSSWLKFKTIEWRENHAPNRHGVATRRERPNFP